MIVKLDYKNESCDINKVETVADTVVLDELTEWKRTGTADDLQSPYFHAFLAIKKSEWQDSNLRPLRPERSALPSWATLR